MLLKKSQSKKRALKGAVLFTVLAVMLVMIVIVMTTITLAGIASKKAYSNWFDNQTNYTAQSLVDNVVRSFQADGKNRDLGINIIQNLQTKNSTVSMDVSGLPASYGTVESFVFKNVGTTDEYNFEGRAAAKQQIIKVTAVVSMGGQTSTYSTYVTGDFSKGTSGGGAPGGYISTAELDALTDAPNTFGRVYAGISSKATKSFIQNQTRLGGDVFYNTDYMIANASAGESVSDPLMIFGRNDPVNELFSGLAVTGELQLKQHMIVSTYPNKYDTDKDIDLSKEEFYNIPYIQCSKLVFGGGDVSKVNVRGALNIYCEEVESYEKEGSYFGGTYNLMCTKDGANNSIYLGKGSELIGWIDSMAADLPAKHSQAEQFLKDNTGNIYCKGNLKIMGQNGGDIKGNLYVKGNLEISGDVKVDGYVFVGGTINTNGKTLNVDAAKKFDSLGTSDADFISACDTAAAGYGQKYKKAFEVDLGRSDDNKYDKKIYQTLDHLQAVYTGKDADNNTVYIGAKESSNLKDDPTIKTLPANTDQTVYIDSNTANNYYKWESKLERNTIYIDPGSDAMWINIGAGCNMFDNSLIVVNDENPDGSVNFFIDDANTGLEINKTTIVTRTYAEKLFETNGKADFKEFRVNYNGQNPAKKNNVKLNLTAFPTDPKEVPHIFLYASTANHLPIAIKNDGLCTFEVVAPSAEFSADADSGSDIEVTYTYNSEKGKSNPNDVTFTRKVKLRVIGSLETGKLNNDNGFAYFYVDDISGDEPAKAEDESYSWTMADGYSSY